MGVDLLTPNEAKGQLIDLKRKHIVFRVPFFERKTQELITALEERFFPPGTEKNREFELIMGVEPTGNVVGPVTYAVIPKTPENYHRLRELMKEFGVKKLDGVEPKNKGKIKQRDPIPSALRHEVFKRDGYKCKECGKTNKETTLHADHIIPVSKGGTDELDNFQTLCEECNTAKKDKIWEGG